MRRSRIATVETKERIVRNASKMFLDQGLAAVGVREIMSAADLTQGAFYRHFESKDELIAEANAAAADRLFATLEMEVAGKSPVEARGLIVEMYLGQSQEKGNTCLCPLATIGAELSHYDQRVREVAIDGYKRFVQLLARHLDEGSRVERLKVASGMVSTMVGAVMLANIAVDPFIAKAILVNAKRSILWGAK